MNAAVLPKQIQAQLEEAERLQTELDGQKAAPPDTGQPAAEEPTQPAVTEPVVEQPAAPAVPKEPGRDAAYWKQRFETMEGKYKAEVAPLHSQLNSATKAVEQMQAQLEAQRQAQPKAEEPKSAKLVTTQDEEKFGSDLIELMRRTVREEASPVDARLGAVEKYLQTIAPQVKRVEKVEQEVAQTRQEKFWTELARVVPDWEQVNADERWLAWLAEADPASGEARQALLQRAQDGLDHQRVAAIFGLFKSATTPPQPQPNRGREELARQVAPSKSSTAAVPPQGAKMYTAADYAHWMDPRRQHDTEKAVRERMLAEMDRAFAEGRVDWR